MSTYKEGDLIEASKGETVIRGRMRCTAYDAAKPLLVLTVGLKSDILHLEANGFSIAVIEHAPDPLPTEPGWYLTGTKEAVYLAADGYWAVPNAFGVTGEDMAKYAPFIRLRPEVEVVAEVLDKIRAVAVGDGGYYDHQFTARELREVGAEFGVTP